MSNKIEKINDDWYEDQVVDTTPTEYVEENIYVDEHSIKNKDLIRLDINVVQSPIFSKNTKRKINQVVTYFFNKNRDTYIKVTPSAGNYIPGETEEKVFIALMQIMKEYGMPQKFVVTPSELQEKLKMSTNRYGSIIRNSLLRLATTNYAFKNTLYSSEFGGTIGEEEITTMFSLKIIVLSLEENKKYRAAIGDKRVKEIYEVNISDHFYKNIIQKGYMVYNGKTLLEIESSTARTIYMLIEKLRFDKLYLKIDTIYLIKRIPLKYTQSKLAVTIKTLEKAFDELVEKNLIASFNFLKEKTWKKSEVEIYFNESSVEDKQQRFYEDRNDLKKLFSKQPTLSDTVNSMLAELKEVHDIEVVNPVESIKVTSETIEKILELMPNKARELKTMPKTIKEAIENYGYRKVELVAKYMKKNKVDKVRAYFMKALENNWVEDEEIITPKVDKTPIEEPQLNFDTNVSDYNEKLYTEFEKLPMDIQNGIETYAYRDYINICGMETKIQKLAFAGSRRKYICEFIEKHPEILGKEDKIEDVSPEQNKEILTDIPEIKKIIVDIIEISNMLNNYSEEEQKKLLRVILEEVSTFIKNRNLTKEKLDEILKKHTGI